MKIIYLGLAAFIAGVALGTSSVQAQDAPKDRRALLAETAAQATAEKGMAMAPAMIAGAKIPCTPTEARFVMTGPSELNGKKASTDFVEVVCKDDLSYVVGARKDGTYVAYDCIEMSAKGGDGKDLPLKCKLPGNRVPPRGFQARLDAAGIKCAISGGRFLGFTSTAAYYELGCTRADGLILTSATPRSEKSEIKAVPCYIRIKSDMACTLTKPEQSIGFISALAAKAPTPCAPTDNRHVAQSRAGDNYYEFACPDGSGYIVEANAAGAFVRAIPCAIAKPLAGGCTLTGATATVAKAP